MSRKRRNPEDRKSGSPEGEPKDKNQEPGKENSEIKEQQPPTANLELPTEQMEVHHHPEVEKKTFKDYILEGFMIFIAVMMGFFAESVRENISNKEHAEQLCIQLVQDLKTDTTVLRQIDSAESIILKRTDSLSVLLRQPVGKADTKNIQRLVVHCYSLWPFHPSLGAITAIKNELHLKQFSESKISSYISAYEGRTEILHKLEELHNQLLRDYIEPFLRLHFTAANLNAAMDHDPVIDGQMRNLTQNDLVQLGVDLALLRNVNDGQINYGRKLKSQAIELIKYVKKQYHLDE